MSHWRTLGDDREFFGAWDFLDEEMRPVKRVAEILAVNAVTLEEKNVNGAKIKANRKPVLSFKNTPKKLIVNATIGAAIAGMYGNDVRQWPGKRILLYGTTTRGARGGTVECVRVAPTPPKGSATPIESRPVDEAMRARQMREAGELADAPPGDEPRAREPGEEG
jgi:hypothetical protein